MNTDSLVPGIETASDPVHSTDDLRQRWRALVSPLGFGERLLWFTFLGEDRCLMKVLQQVPIGIGPDPDLVDGLLETLASVIAERGESLSVAMLLTRPGRGPLSIGDRGWAGCLAYSARRYGVTLEPIFRAHDESLVLVD